MRIALARSSRYQRAHGRGGSVRRGDHVQRRGAQQRIGVRAEPEGPAGQEREHADRVPVSGAAFHRSVTGDHGPVSRAQCRVRPADASDAAAVAELACELAQSFTFSRARFDRSYPALLASAGACLLVAVHGDERLGYLLGFEQWAAARDCALVALATRRAAPFYRALGYEQSAIYHRKILDGQPWQ
jgi:hypothetical protein